MSSYGPPPGPGQPEYDPNNPAGTYPPPPPPSYGQPAYGTPPQGAQGDIPPPPPVSGQPNYGQPNYGAPVSGQPSYGAPISGQPNYGAPVSGQPGYGQQPNYGAPVSGQPGYGGYDAAPPPPPPYGTDPQAPYSGAPYAAPYADPNQPVQGYGAPLPPPGPPLQGGGWQAPPPQGGGSGAGKVVGIIVGAVLVFALLICGGVVYGINQAGNAVDNALDNLPTTVPTLPTLPTEDPFPTPTGGSEDDDAADSVKVGDCIVNDGTDENASIRVVPCAKDTLEVLIRIPFTDDGEEACKDVEGADSWYMYTSSSVGGVGDYVLCLKTLTEAPKTS
ncbi:LppU/SCO3897 family protein [Catenuloplanes japonicus]|uniref:LppU/SCO3897 family protein n=1 Tax=Catenuloplanes japonicus TaxID=33876 RepID=UPI00068C249D|nr:hypothetical protein [Catenuloplanes japonicus]